MEIQFYNFVPHNENLINWDSYKHFIEKHGFQIPLSKMIWYPCFTLTSSMLAYKILSFFYHIVPGFLMDMYLIATKRRPRFVILNKY